MLLACPGAAETMPSHGPTGKLQLVAILDLSLSKVKGQRSFLTRKEYPICRSPPQIETYSLG